MESTETMKSDRRATHIGTCQACGSAQKLPLGVLSQHGYEVKWSQFQGVCVGHGHLPYELSAEMLPELIATSKAARKRMRDTQKELRAPTVINRVSYEFRRNLRISFPEAARIETETKTNGSHSWFAYSAVAERDGLVEPVSSYLISADVVNALSLVNHLRSRDADSLQFRIDQESRYIKWQEGRLADWKIRPLQDVIEVEEAEAAKKREALDAKKKLREDKRTAKILRDGERAARLIAKYGKLVPAEIRENLARYTHPSLHAELYTRRGIKLPPTVDSLLYDLVEEAHGKKRFSWHPDPWKQVEAANAIKAGGQP